MASHPRSGTHLLIDFFRRQFADCAAWKYPLERLDRLYLSLDALSDPRHAPGDRKALSILRRCRRPLLKTHALPDFSLFPFESHTAPLPRSLVESLRTRASFFYIFRDGRKVLCSYHALTGGNTTIGQFMRQEISGVNRVQAWVDHVSRWMDVDGVTPVKMESLIREAGRVLDKLEKVLGQPSLRNEPLLPPRATSVWASRRDRLLARCPSSTAILPKRRVETSDWRNAFTADDRKFFFDHGGEMLSKLGYEVSDRWAIDEPREIDQTAPAVLQHLESA